MSTSTIIMETKQAVCGPILCKSSYPMSCEHTSIENFHALGVTMCLLIISVDLKAEENNHNSIWKSTETIV